MLNINQNKQFFRELPLKLEIKERFLKMTRFLFPQKSSSNHTEEGEKAARALIARLKNVKISLLSVKDPLLVSLSNDVMGGLIKAAEGYQKDLSKKMTKYRWINFEDFSKRAENVLSLDLESPDTNSIIQTLFFHFLEESKQKVERDLQILKEYQAQKLQERQLGEKESVEVANQLDGLLLPIKKLQEEQLPSLNSLREWTLLRNQKRQALFNRALSLTDQKLKNILIGNRSFIPAV